MFAAQRQLLNLSAQPDHLTTRDMFVPTCATCHMSGLNGRGVTHDPSERLSYYLFAEVTKPRPNAAQAQAKMKDICVQCHNSQLINRVYEDAEAVVKETNEKILSGKTIMDALQKDGIISPANFTEPIEFSYFDLWHYYGRTAKHAAFMGGADFVQWHGNYPILQHLVEIRAEAGQLRKEHAASK
jgi:mono/diheme cytochrome c family protein